MKFDKNLKYTFSKDKYFQYIKSQGRYISSVEKNFGKKYDKENVKIINESQGVVDGVYQVMRIWCDEI
ncbi:hypothetical protein [Terrisporobacter sp.]